MTERDETMFTSLSAWCIFGIVMGAMLGWLFTMYLVNSAIAASPNDASAGSIAIVGPWFMMLFGFVGYSLGGLTCLVIRGCSGMKC